MLQTLVPLRFGRHGTDTSSVAQDETLTEVIEDWAELKLPQLEQAVRFPFLTCSFVSMDFLYWEISEGAFSVASLMCNNV